MADQSNDASNEPEKQPAAPAGQQPEAIADEQLDGVAGGLLTWDNGESLGGGGGPVAKPKHR